ncbi:MAG TPA: formyltransferase family protein [Candidatus Paceibacterota bacterium]|nr:formyltransferase family protein [Candidatus Paceibacterota bacterium]
MTPKLLVFATGTPEGGGSGFENLVNASRDGRLTAEVVGVVCNFESGGVREKADRLGIPFIYMPGPYTAEAYLKIVSDTDADFAALSGWLKLVKGLDPKTTFNIHPGPLPEFGGAGLYGHFVHEAVMKAYQEGRITHSAVSMHFVTPEFDEGPVFFSHQVEIFPDDTADTLGKRVNEAEHRYQPEITNLVLNGTISWDGKEPDTLRGARRESI